MVFDQAPPKNLIEILDPWAYWEANSLEVYKEEIPMPIVNTPSRNLVSNLVVAADT